MNCNLTILSFKKLFVLKEMNFFQGDMD